MAEAVRPVSEAEFDTPEEPLDEPFEEALAAVAWPNSLPISPGLFWALKVAPSLAVRPITPGLSVELNPGPPEVAADCPAELAWLLIKLGPAAT